MWFLLNSSVTRKLFVRFTSVMHQVKGFSMEIQIKMGHTPPGGRSLLVCLLKREKGNNTEQNWYFETP